jgi:hypothetical protein
LDLWAAHGCSSLKVSYVAGNGVAHGLYLGAGFRPSVKSRTYRHARALTASEVRR